MTASSCPSCGAPVTPEVVDGIVREEHRCEYEDVAMAAGRETAFLASAWLPVTRALWSYGYSRDEAVQIVTSGASPRMLLVLLDTRMLRPPMLAEDGGS